MPAQFRTQQVAENIKHNASTIEIEYISSNIYICIDAKCTKRLLYSNRTVIVLSSTLGILDYHS